MERDRRAHGLNAKAEADRVAASGEIMQEQVHAHRSEIYRANDAGVAPTEIVNFMK